MAARDKTHLHPSFRLFKTPIRLPVYPAPLLPCLLACIKSQFSFFIEMFLIHKHFPYFNRLNKIISLIVLSIFSLLVFSKFLQSTIIIIGEEKLNFFLYLSSLSIWGLANYTNKRQINKRKFINMCIVHKHRNTEMINAKDG